MTDLMNSHLAPTLKNAIKGEHQHMMRTILPKEGSIAFRREEYLAISNLAFTTLSSELNPYHLKRSITDHFESNKDYKIWDKRDIQNNSLDKYIKSNINVVDIEVSIDGGIMKITTHLNKKKLLQKKEFQRLLNLYLYEYNNLLSERYILIRQFFRHRASITEKEFVGCISKKIPKDLILYIFSYIGDWYQNEVFFSYLDSLVKNVYATTMT